MDESTMNEPTKRKPYPSDLTDEQWERLKPLVERTGGPGNPGTLDLGEVVNALLGMLRTGCQWGYLPHDFPEESSVRYYHKEMAPRWHLATDQCDLAASGAGGRGSQAAPQCGDHLAKIFADQGYRGDFVAIAQRHFGIPIEIVKRDPPFSGCGPLVAADIGLHCTLRSLC